MYVTASMRPGPIRPGDNDYFEWAVVAIVHASMRPGPIRPGDAGLLVDSVKAVFGLQ